MSEGEDAVWLQLRARKMDAGWEREATFCERKWRVDILNRYARIAIEVEGATHTGGRHTRGEGFALDCEKYARLTIEGYSLFRCTTEQALSGVVVEWVIELLNRRTNT